MKKLFSLVLTLALVATMTFGVVANASGSFVDSPSLSHSITVTNENPDGCNAKVILVPYAERNTLPQADKDTIEASYKVIASNENVSDFCPEATGDELAVSDLFDLRFDDNYETKATHVDNEHGNITIILEGDDLNGFKYLLHYVDNQWVVVSDAVYADDKVTFVTDGTLLSPFAIVVSTATPGPAPTGDIGLWVATGVAVIAAFGIIVLLVTRRREEER